MDQTTFCTQKPTHMEHFLEICLLLLLHDELGYGYGLIEQLKQFGFSESDLNVSTLYRTLRKMEHENLVTSGWEEGEQGPRRRVYKITLTGRDALGQWIQILKSRKSRIETLLNKYDLRTR